LDEWPVERAADITGVDAATIRRLGEEIATVQPSLLRAGVGAQRHLGAPMAYRTMACVPALAGSWLHPGGGFSYLPVGRIMSGRWAAQQRADLRPGPVRSINMSALGDAL